MASSVLTVVFKSFGAKRTTRSVMGLSAALLVAGLAAKRAAGYLITASDAYTSLQNKTRVFASSQKDANVRLKGAIQISRKMNSTLSETAGIMQRVSISQKTAGFSTKELMKITENLTMAALLSGATTQESEAALRQFGQGMAANRLAGQELNSVLEQTPLIAVMLAEGLTKAGKHGIVAAGDLRRLGEAGELTTKVLVDIFGKAMPELERMLELFIFPIERLITSLERETELLVGQVMEMTGVTKSLKGALIGMTDKFEDWNDMLMEGGPGRDEFIKQLQTMAWVLGGALVAVALPAVTVALVALAAAIMGPIGAVLALGAFVGWLFSVRDASIHAGGYIVSLSSIMQSLYEFVFSNDNDIDQSWVGQLGGEYLEGAILSWRILSDKIMLAYASLKSYTAEKRLQTLSEAKSGRLSHRINNPGGSAAPNDFMGSDSELDAKIKEAQRSVEMSNATLSMIPKTIVESADALQAELDQTGGGVEFIFKSMEESAQAFADGVLTALPDGILSAADSIKALSDAQSAAFQKSKDEAERLQGLADDVSEAEAKRGAAFSARLKLEQQALEAGKEKIEDYDKLRSSIDAVFEAEAKYAAGMLIVEEAREIGHISALQEIEDKRMLLEILNQTVSDELFDKLEGMPALMAGANKGLADFVESMGSPAELMAGGFTQALDMASNAIVEFATTGKLNFKKFARDMINMILKVIIQLLILKAIQAATGMGGIPSGGGGGSTSMPTGGMVGSAIGGMPTLNVLGKAKGGPVSGGKPYMVGEKGPELFTPSVGGNISPNSAGAPMQNNIKIVNIDDPKSIPAAMGTAEGEEVILNVISRNSEILREII